MGVFCQGLVRMRVGNNQKEKTGRKTDSQSPRRSARAAKEKRFFRMGSSAQMQV